MMSLESIQALNEEIAAEAAAEKRVPFAPDGPTDVDRWPPFPFPNLGSYVPDNWQLLDVHWFVDKTGKGKDWEIALSVSQFREALRQHLSEHPGDGLAITEEGPFQAVVSAFRKQRG